MAVVDQMTASVINNSQSTPAYLNNFSSSPIQQNTSNANLAKYSTTVNKTLTNFSNEMSELLRRSIDRLDNICFKVRNCVYEIENQQAHYTHRNVNPVMDRSVPPSIALLKPSIDEPPNDTVATKLGNRLKRTKYQRHGSMPTSSGDQAKTLTPFGSKATLKSFIDLTKEESVMLQIKQHHREMEDKVNLRAKQDELHSKQEEIKAKQEDLTSKQEQQMTLLREKVDSTVQLLQNQYSKKRVKRSKKVKSKSLTTQVSGKLIIDCSKDSHSDKLWYGSQHSSKQFGKKKAMEIKNTKLSRKYASENFHGTAKRELEKFDENGLLGVKTLKISQDNSPEWKVIMHTQRQSPRYELKPNAVFRTSANILDEITLRDVEPLKAEYPRKDHLVEISKPNDDLLYKLINSKDSLEYLINVDAVPLFDKQDQDRGQTKKHATKRKRPVLVSKLHPIREEVISREKKTSKRKGPDAGTSKRKGPDAGPAEKKRAVGKFDMTSIDRKLKALERKTVSLKEYQAYRKISNKDAKHRLRKYLVDPGKSFKQSLIVMPLLVEFDNDIVPHLTKKTSENAEKSTPEEVLRPYIYTDLHAAVAPTTVMTMAVEHVQPKLNKKIILEPNKPTLTHNDSVLVQKMLACEKTSNKTSMKPQDNNQLVSFIVNEDKRHIVDSQYKTRAERDVGGLKTTMDHASKKVKVRTKVRPEPNEIKSALEGMEEKFKKAVGGEPSTRHKIMGNIEKEINGILLAIKLDSDSDDLSNASFSGSGLLSTSKLNILQKSIHKLGKYKNEELNNTKQRSVPSPRRDSTNKYNKSLDRLPKYQTQYERKGSTDLRKQTRSSYNPPTVAIQAEQDRKPVRDVKRIEYTPRSNTRATYVAEKEEISLKEIMKQLDDDIQQKPKVVEDQHKLKVYRSDSNEMLQIYPIVEKNAAEKGIPLRDAMNKTALQQNQTNFGKDEAKSHEMLLRKSQKFTSVPPYEIKTQSWARYDTIPPPNVVVNRPPTSPLRVITSEPPTAARKEGRLGAKIISPPKRPHKTNADNIKTPSKEKVAGTKSPRSESDQSKTNVSPRSEETFEAIKKVEIKHVESIEVFEHPKEIMTIFNTHTPQWEEPTLIKEESSLKMVAENHNVIHQATCTDEIKTAPPAPTVIIKKITDASVGCTLKEIKGEKLKPSQKETNKKILTKWHSLENPSLGDPHWSDSKFIAKKDPVDSDVKQAGDVRFDRIGKLYRAAKREEEERMTAAQKKIEKLEKKLASQTRMYCDEVNAVAKVIRDEKDSIVVDPMDKYLTPFMHAVKQYRLEDRHSSFLDYLEEWNRNNGVEKRNTVMKTASAKEVAQEEYLMVSVGVATMNVKNTACQYEPDSNSLSLSESENFYKNSNNDPGAFNAMYRREMTYNLHKAQSQNPPQKRLSTLTRTLRTEVFPTQIAEETHAAAFHRAVWVYAKDLSQASGDNMHSMELAQRNYNKLLAYFYGVMFVAIFCGLNLKYDCA